jgi:flagellar hook-associated protein 2
MAVSSATSAPSPTSGGTNIDVNGIVGKLMAVEQKPLTALNAKEASYQSKISAFGQVKGALSGFQSALQGLSSANKFQANVATSSDPTVFTATAMTSASVGSHAIAVNSLAQGQRLAAAGVASTNTQIGSGVLTFDFGTVSEGVFTPNAGKFRTGTLDNAFITNKTVAATPGTAISGTTTFTPAANSSGVIPEGTFTINGVSVDEIDLLDGDSPIHRAANIAEAFDDAYVKSGGTPGTFTAAGGVITKAADGNKTATFGVTGSAPDSTKALSNVSTLASQTGLTIAQLGTQQTYGNSTVEVASTVGLAVGDTISGGGFPEGTTVEEVIDATHFVASATGKDNSKDKEGVKLNTSTVSSSRTVVIEPGNGSLDGIRDTINAAKIGVTASIVNDGSDTPNRLVLSSDTVGANTNMRITAGGDPALAKLLSHDPVSGRKLSEISAGKDTSLTIDGIEVTKKTNTINDVIPGVTLNLLKPSSTPVTLDIGRDTATVKTSVEEFVKAYNELKKVTTDLTAYNPATKKGAALQGDSAMRSLDSQIDTILSTPLGTPSGSLTTLSQIGVSKQANGTLAIDSGKLNSAINSKFGEVAGLFAAIGKSTDNLIDFKSTTAATKPGNYAVFVSSLATQGNTTGRVNLSSGSTTIESGTKLTASVDGTTAQVTLTPGSYTGEALAKMVQEAINSTPAFSSTGKTVNASINRNGFLSVTSNAYGSNSSVSLGADDKDGRTKGQQKSTGTPVAEFMGTAVSTAGTNVAGTINGVAATGAGQLLTSSTGESTGLQVHVGGGALGARGTVNFTQGYAHKLNDFVNSALGGSGLLTGRLDGLNSSVKGISKERDAINARLNSVEDRYRRQYTKLDATLSGMNATSTYLSQQLAKL